LTFLEVVCAVAILAMVTATVVGAMSFVVAMQQRQQKKLNAAEVANRLMLIYLDDPTELDRMGPLVPYGGAKYRWSKAEGGVTFRPAKTAPAPGQPGGGNNTTASGMERFVNVSISAWLSEESGGAFKPEPETPASTLARLVDPVPMRNPDSLNYTVSNDELRARMIAGFLRGGTRTTTTGGGIPKPATRSGTPGSGGAGPTGSTPGGSGGKPVPPPGPIAPVKPAKPAGKGGGK